MIMGLISVQQLVFYVLAFMSLCTALVTILSNNPVRSVLALVLTFFCSAGIWLLAQAEFLALILILVYVGAVMTLFLFVVMMLDINVVSLRSRIYKSIPYGLLVVALIGFLVFVARRPETFSMPHLNEASLEQVSDINAEQIAMVLYDKYAFAFELAGILLLVATIAAICLLNRPLRGAKVQNPRLQVRVQRNERIRMVDIQSEKEDEL